MELLLERTEKTSTYTAGHLFIINELGKALLCDTLEPPIKVDNRHKPKAIPAGRYGIVVTWSPKFQRWLPLLLNVPFRDGIRIHAGNHPADTAGCILVGTALQPGHVYNSRRALEALMKRLKERPEGEAIHLTVKN